MPALQVASLPATPQRWPVNILLIDTHPFIKKSDNIKSICPSDFNIIHGIQNKLLLSFMNKTIPLFLGQGLYRMAYT